MKHRPSFPLTVLFVFTTINLFNYLDRSVLSAVLEPLGEDLELLDRQKGFLATAFIVVYTLAAPAAGFIGDRWRRNKMTAGAVAIWSVATIASGLAPNYESLVVARACVGIGEAGYATVAPSVIADVFRPHKRGRMLAWFYLAIPVGTACGYIVGGWVGEYHGWRWAMLIAGLPGLVLAIVALFVPEAERGALDDEGPTERVSFGVALKWIFRTRAWRINTVGLVLMTFALGGISHWMPSFLIRARNLDLGTANLLFGLITFAAGLVGTLLGGYLGDRAQARHHGGYFTVSGIGLLLGAPFIVLIPWISNITVMAACLFFAALLLLLNTGPLNAVLVGCVPANMRATAVAVNVFFIHAFGDSVSPYIIGYISDLHSLALGLALTAAPTALGALVLLAGARRIARTPGGLRAVDKRD